MKTRICDVCRSTNPYRSPSIRLMRKWSLRYFFYVFGKETRFKDYDFCEPCFKKIAEACFGEALKEMEK